MDTRSPQPVPFGTASRTRVGGHRGREIFAKDKTARWVIVGLLGAALLLLSLRATA